MCDNVRIIWVDWAKAILIYLMVVGHCLPAPWQGTLIYVYGQRFDTDVCQGIYKRSIFSGVDRRNSLTSLSLSYYLFARRLCTQILGSWRG